MPKIKSPNSSTIKINTLKPEEKVKICTEESVSCIFYIYYISIVLSPHPNKPKTPQNDSSSPNYFKTMNDKMTITGEFRNNKMKSIYFDYIFYV